MKVLFYGEKVIISTFSDYFGFTRVPNGPLGELSYLEDAYAFMWQNGAPFDLLGLAQHVATTSPIIKKNGWNSYSTLAVDVSPLGTLVYIEYDNPECTTVFQWMTYGPSPAFGEVGELISTVGNTFVSGSDDDDYDDEDYDEDYDEDLGVTDIMSYLGNSSLD